jgi:serine O-acetyltransferase
MQRLSLGTEAAVAAYVGRQLDHFFPDGKLAQQFPLLEQAMPSALRRVQHCIDAVRMWPSGEFDHLHSSQYCQFLYYLAHTVWKGTGDRALCNKLFGLNKALNGIDLFYEIEMPEVFFIGHSVGIVLAKATYGERLVLYQGCTVGKNHGQAPVLGNEVVMFPGSRVLGGSVLGNGTIVAQGVSVVNRQIPGQCLVFSGSNGELTLRPAGRDLLGDFFRR